MAAGRRQVSQGAEARIYETVFMGRPAILKERFVKTYRHPALEQALSQQRTKAEVRAMTRCRMNGISTPAIYFVDLENNCIYMEHVSPGVTVREHIQTVQQEHDGGDGQATMSLAPLAKAIGTTVGRLHLAGIIHGDLTTSNMLLRPLAADRHATRSAFDTPGGRTELVMLDFGLGQGDASAEDMGVDLYVLERAFVSTHPNTEALFDVLLESYRATCGKDAAEVMRKLDEIRLRGRKRTMVG